MANFNKKLKTGLKNLYKKQNCFENVWECKQVFSLLIKNEFKKMWKYFNIFHNKNKIFN